MKKKQQLIAKGLLPENDDAFDKVGYVRSVYDWLDTDTGRRILCLAGRFGYSCDSCQVCDVCRGPAVQMMARQARATLDMEIALLGRRLKRCIKYSKRSVSGVALPLAMASRVCGTDATNVEAGAVRVDAKNFFMGRGCFGCYDLSRRAGYQRHKKMKECPLDRRFCRMLFVGHDQESSCNNFQDFLCQSCVNK